MGASLLRVGCVLGQTKGHDPQANGAAENRVGRRCGMAPAVLGHYEGE